PTAHFEGSMLYMLYPPDPRTEKATMREGQMCAREGITINLFLVPSWSQSEEDIRFAYRLAEGTKGRVFFTAGRDLDRYVVWDYVKRKREIVADPPRPRGVDTQSGIPREPHGPRHRSRKSLSGLHDTG